MNPFSLVIFSIDRLYEIDDSVSSTINKVAAYWNHSSTNQSSTGAVYFENADLSGNNLFVGFSDGSIANFALDPLLQQDNVIPAKLASRVRVTLKKPSQVAIYALPSESSLVAHIDHTIYFLTLKDLKPTFAAIKGVSCFAIDSKLQSPLQLVAGIKKSLVVYLLDSQFKLDVFKLSSLPESAIKVSIFSELVCFADSKSYYLMSLNSERLISLFPYDISYMKPEIHSIGKKEFLLVTCSTQGFGIGVFISAKGEPIRGTLQWPTTPLSVVFHDHFIISLLSNSTIQIHDIEAQSLVQTIVIPSSHPPKFLKLSSFPFTLGDSSGELYIVVGTEIEIFGLRMIPWDQQLHELFEKDQIDQAISLLAKIGAHDESVVQLGMRGFLYNRAGFVLLEKGLFSKAFFYFKKGKLLPSLLIPAFFDEFHIPVDEKLAPFTIKAGHFRESSERELAITLLVDFLEWAKETDLADHLKSEIDDALLCCYTILNDSRLKVLILGDNHCTLARAQSYLMNYERYYMLSLLYKHLNMPRETLEIWTNIVSGELLDTEFEGLPTFVDYLKGMSDRDLVLRYGSWLMTRDPARGVQVFIDRKDDIFQVQEVVGFLDTFSRRAKTEYLESLIHNGTIIALPLYEELAHQYLDDIFHLANDSLFKELDAIFQTKMKGRVSYIDYLRMRRDSFSSSRLKFYDFVSRKSTYGHSSAFYDGLLSQIGTGRFHVERLSVLVAKENYEEVLKTFAVDLSDSIGAERYATIRVDSNTSLQFLAQLYIDQENQEDLLSLITKHTDAMNAMYLLSNLPSHWKVSALQPILQNYEETSRKKSTNSRLAFVLSKAKHLKLRKVKTDLECQRPTFVHPSKKCPLCGQKFTATAGNISLGKNGIVVHDKCFI